MGEPITATLAGDAVNFACPSCNHGMSWPAAQFRQWQEASRSGACELCGEEVHVGNPFRPTAESALLHVVRQTDSMVPVSPEIMPRGPLFFVHSNVTNQTYGPADADTVRQWLVSRRVVPTDRVCQGGASEWIPILKSEFAAAAVDELRIEQLSAATCPRCSAAMVAVIRRSGMGLALIIIGVLLTPVFIGIPLWIVGYSMRFGGKGRVAYQCPRCNYATP